MDGTFVEWVYDTLQGDLVEKARLPGVENLFAEGGFCMTRYGQMLDAYQRLRERLEVEDEDLDVEEMIWAFMDIERTVSFKMFEYGRKLADREL